MVDTVVGEVRESQLSPSSNRRITPRSPFPTGLLLSCQRKVK